MTDWPSSPGVVAPEVAASLDALFPDTAFELRWSLAGTAAVRVLAPRGPVARGHAEPPDPPAPWSASVRCGTAAGWLLAAAPPTVGEPAAMAVIKAAVDRHTALAMQALAAHRAALESDLLESLTHRLRTDVMTLQAVAEGRLSGVLDPAERAEVAREVSETGRDAQRRLSAARETMTALHAGDRGPEPIADALRSELDGLGLGTGVHEPAGEQSQAGLPAPGWAACARLLAAALATDGRLGGAEAVVRIAPDPLGWAVEAGPDGDGRPVAWTTRLLGPLAGAGQIVAAGGGCASAAELAGDRLRLRLTVPGRPSR